MEAKKQKKKKKKHSDRRVRDLTHYAGCCVIPLTTERRCARVCRRRTGTKVGGGVGRRIDPMVCVAHHQLTAAATLDNIIFLSNTSYYNMVREIKLPSQISFSWFFYFLLFSNSHYCRYDAVIIILFCIPSRQFFGLAEYDNTYIIKCIGRTSSIHRCYFEFSILKSMIIYIFFIFFFSRDTLKYIYTISAIPTAARAFGETNDEFSLYICIDTTALL